MYHSFDVSIAKKYGIEEAVLINNLYFWISKNKANEKNFYDGRYWTYNTNKALSDLFPYISESKMFRVIKHLEEEGIVVKGNYNKEKWDRTCWYSFTDKGISLFSRDFQNEEIHFSLLKNGDSQNEMTIPDNKHTDINIKEEDKSSKKDDSIDYSSLKVKWEEINPNLSSIRCVSVKRKRAIKLLLKNNNAKVEDLIKAFKIISICSFCQGENNHKWKASFDWLINDTKSCFNRLLEGEYCNGVNELAKFSAILKDIEISDTKDNNNLIIGDTEYR